MLEALVAFDEVRRWSERQFDGNEVVPRRPLENRRDQGIAAPRRARRRAALTGQMAAVRGALTLSRPS